MVGNVSELSAQEEDVWEEEVYEPDILPNNEILETEPELTEEITDSSLLDEGIETNEAVISKENEAESVVAAEEKPSETSTTVTPEPNAADDTQLNKLESHQVTEPSSEPTDGKISPENEKLTEPSTTTTSQEINPNQLNKSPSEEILLLENGSGEILPSITYDPPIIPNHSETVEKLQPAVQPMITENATTVAEKLVQPATVQAMECDNPAIYFNDIREAHLPAVEIPLYLDMSGQPISSVGLFAVKLRIPFGFADFEVKEVVFKEILKQSDPCNAQFIPETGILTVPQVEIPTFIVITDSIPPQSGPVIKCRAVLHQSNIRISVLSLKELQCDPPLQEPIQTDIK
ncbi:hypothetical protein THII_3908 [Thioploca ingrica]|uniref:Uncharacterized protein n=1 Tax=Thioploca ingrica TaxID=40754 RepID=A0A090AR26_9GAMM|nr:hypothetical protein THII_3908 [Thioploca ingrica]